MLNAVHSQLARTALFRGVPDSVLQDMAARCIPRRYPKGSVVFVHGEPGERCYVIVSGQVKVSVYHSDGREAVLRVLGPGEVVGELALFDDAPRSATAAALTDADLLSLSKDVVLECATRHPELAVTLFKVLSQRLRIANQALQDVAFFDVPGRVARRLADLADAYGVESARGVLIDLPLSQEGLASMVGATRESVNKAVAGLTRRGLVFREGRSYVVSDVDRLRERAL